MFLLPGEPSNPNIYNTSWYSSQSHVFLSALGEGYRDPMRPRLKKGHAYLLLSADWLYISETLHFYCWHAGLAKSCYFFSFTRNPCFLFKPQQKQNWYLLVFNENLLKATHYPRDLANVISNP